MATLWRKGVQNNVTLDLSTDDLYGKDGFECIYAYAGESTVNTVDSANWSETIKNVDANNCTANGDTDSGSTKITVKDTDDNNKVSNFNKGDVIKVKDKDIYFYVQEVNADEGYIIARNPISGDIADGDELDRVGNTGVYSVGIQLDDTGIVTFIVSNPKIELENEVLVVEVSDYNDKLDEILNVVKSGNRVRARIQG